MSLQLFGLAANESAHGLDGLFQGLSGRGPHDLPCFVHAVVGGIPGHFAQNALTLTHYFRNRQLVLLTQLQQLFCGVKIHVHPVCPSLRLHDHHVVDIGVLQ